MRIPTVLAPNPNRPGVHLAESTRMVPMLRHSPRPLRARSTRTVSPLLRITYPLPQSRHEDLTPVLVLETRHIQGVLHLHPMRRGKTQNGGTRSGGGVRDQTLWLVRTPNLLRLEPTTRVRRRRSR